MTRSVKYFLPLIYDLLARARMVANMEHDMIAEAFVRFGFGEGKRHAFRLDQPNEEVPQCNDLFVGQFVANFGDIFDTEPVIVDTISAPDPVDCKRHIVGAGELPNCAILGDAEVGRSQGRSSDRHC